LFLVLNLGLSDPMPEYSHFARQPRQLPKWATCRGHGTYFQGFTPDWPLPVHGKFGSPGTICHFGWQFLSNPADGTR